MINYINRRSESTLRGDNDGDEGCEKMECEFQCENCLLDRVSDSIDRLFAIPEMVNEFEVVHRILQREEGLAVQGIEEKNYTERAKSIYTNKNTPRESIDTFLDTLELFPHTIPVQERVLVDSSI